MTNVRIAEDWSFELGGDFRRRVEEGNIVFWKPGQTIWCALFQHDGDSYGTLETLKRESKPGATHAFEDDRNGVLKFGYLAPAPGSDPDAKELTTFCVSASDYLIMSYYFDDPVLLDWALACWRSVSYLPTL